MDLARTIRLESVPSPLLSHIGSRDAVLWLSDNFVGEAGKAIAADVLRLPWRLILSETSDPELLAELEKSEDAVDPLVLRRGFVHVVDTNPADVLLPPRCLPIYLLNGRENPPSTAGLAAKTRRFTMLDLVSRLDPKELIILVGATGSLPSELGELWQDGLRTILTVVSTSPVVAGDLESWRVNRQSAESAAFLPLNAKEFCEDLLTKYRAGQAAGRLILRIRGSRGIAETIDITGLDSPEQPLLANYELLQNENLLGLQPTDLAASEVQEFFSDASISWRPYAAGMPWERDPEIWSKVRATLRRLDRQGAESGRILYISSESGAGATTLLRSLAWQAAEQGYPTLIARDAPFTPKALEVATFLNRVIERASAAFGESDERLYEAPWVIGFDRMHWEGREGDLRHFLRELQQSGRPVCILMVTGPILGMDFYDNRHYVPIANLTHQVPLEGAAALGQHLNKFLAPHGPIRTPNEWRGFYEATAVYAKRGIAAFWIALSFWLQRQIDINETVQSWIFRQFNEKIHDPEVRRAILDIAALSSERLPLPESLLPLTTDWPVTQKIEDIRRLVPGLALARIDRDGQRFWAMAHDLIGRYLLTAIYYDHAARDAAGLLDAENPEHLRFLVLRRLSRLPTLGHTPNREIAEEFPMSIFKIDPDHGHANFVSFWKDVLTAIDEMPKTLHATSRAFRHHPAISRRRVVKQRDDFPTGAAERVKLLERAISDIRYALENIPATSENEADLNLYNSLALAYYDLAEEEADIGAPSERTEELRLKAHEATQRAYRLSPDNSFVTETYARSLLNEARSVPEAAAENAVEVLNIVYAAMDRDRSGQRRFALGRLADAAIQVLLQMNTPDPDREPGTEVEALVQGIQALARGVNRSEDMNLSDFPPQNRLQAAELLARPILQGNAQAVRLRYLLKCLDQPSDFRGQLELLQSLQGGSAIVSPQMRLEFALLLQQRDRHHEADRLFKDLRRLWRQGDHYVEVPDRLRWLLTADGKTQRQVTARIVFKYENRSAAKIRELQDTEVPFRPQEFGQREFKPGSEIKGFISFGHNGPFLRPTTAAHG